MDHHAPLGRGLGLPRRPTEREGSSAQRDTSPAGQGDGAAADTQQQVRLAVTAKLVAQSSGDQRRYASCASIELQRQTSMGIAVYRGLQMPYEAATGLCCSFYSLQYAVARHLCRSVLGCLLSAHQAQFEPQAASASPEGDVDRVGGMLGEVLGPNTLSQLMAAAHNPRQFEEFLGTTPALDPSFLHLLLPGSNAAVFSQVLPIHIKLVGLERQ